MAQVPAVAVAAVIRLDLPVHPAAVAYEGLRGAAALEGRQVSVDELVVVDAHDGIVNARRDT
jgi:hypothetical protein